MNNYIVKALKVHVDVETRALVAFSLKHIAALGYKTNHTDKQTNR